MNSNSTLFSAVQPSGNLTLGNYIGTMRHWNNMQDNYKSLYCIADLHALTTSNKNNNLNISTLDTLALYLACGVNPEKSIIFIQSQVYQHCQLNWILSGFSYFGEMLRMHQFSTKSQNYSGNQKENNLSLLNYPVLMASDILLYQTNFVPVGEDQKQHLELTCHIAHRFNNVYNNVFTIPKILINQNGSKIMSLLDPKKKMSKSDNNKNNVIFLLDKPSSIFFKIKNAVTDSDQSAKIYYDIKSKPGISNLLTILSVITNKEIHFLEKDLNGTMYFDFKNIVADQLSKFLLNLQKSYFYYRKNESYLKKIAAEGALKAQEKANITLNKIYSKMNFFTV